MPAINTATSAQSDTSTQNDTEYAYRAMLYYAQATGNDNGMEPVLVDFISDLHALVEEYGMNLAELVQETAPK